MSGDIIVFPTEEQELAALRQMIASLKEMQVERRAAAAAAVPALQRLVEAVLVRSGQGRHLRGLLYSMWNGKPVSLGDSLHLDWALQKDFCAVLLAFGFNGGGGCPEFFYDSIKAAVQCAGLWPWFLEAREEGRPL